MRSYLWPLGVLYQSIVKARNLGFDKGWIESFQVDVPVVSVGNITAGGTGKTPVIAALLEWATDQRISVGVVSRGYKGKFEGVQKVDPARKGGANYFGDEPFMLAQGFPDTPIFVCPDRVLACKELVKQHSVNLIFADDAFQHRRLQRQSDIVILDAMEKIENYLPLPVGRGREPLNSLKRAKFIILNKVNLADAESVVWILKTLDQIAAAEGWELPPIIESSYKVESILNPRDQIATWMNQKNVIAVSGIARPLSFEKILREQGIEPLKHFSFSDHYTYEKSKIGQIIRYMDLNNVAHILTTEKDAEKLLVFSELVDRIWVVKISVEFSENVRELYEDIRRSLL